MKNITYFVLLISALISCNSSHKEVVNIGFICPQSAMVTNLGIAPSQAMQLAVLEYNKTRSSDEPKMVLHIQDDKWNPNLAVPAFNQLKKEHNIDFLFINNSNGTINLQEKLLKDNILSINPLNNDESLRSACRNTYFIAKSTKQANLVIAERLLELGKKRVVIFHNDYHFYNQATRIVKDYLQERGVQVENHITEKGQKDYTQELVNYSENECDAYAFFGYPEYGFAMKQARDLGITAPFFGCTEILDTDFYNFSDGTIKGTEFSYLTRIDGNKKQALNFFNSYIKEWSKMPHSDWPPMQAYDAMNIFIKAARNFNNDNDDNLDFTSYLRKKLDGIQDFKGVCGTLNMRDNQSIEGIKFKLYKYSSFGRVIQVN